MHEIYNGTPYATQKLRSIQLVGTLTHETTRERTLRNSFSNRDVTGQSN